MSSERLPGLQRRKLTVKNLDCRDRDDDRPLTGDAFRRYAMLEDIPPAHRHVHLMRHSIATHLLDAGQGIEFVKDHLGHRALESTLVYTRVSDRRRTRTIRRLERSLRI
jgi:site-specific recombinase XerD